MDASWLPSTVRSPAIPGISALPPPEKPANRCGSMNPVRIRTSHAMMSRFIQMAWPRSVIPSETWDSGSKALFCTTR